MVEIEEMPPEDATAKPEPPKGFKYKKAKKDLPSVSHLLAHGSDESQNRPKTFWSECWYPLFIAVCFAISLLTFHYAPHDKSVQPKGKFSTQYKRSQQGKILQQQHHQQQMDMGMDLNTLKEVPLPPTTATTEDVKEDKDKPQQQEQPRQQQGGDSGSLDGEL